MNFRIKGIRQEGPGLKGGKIGEIGGKNVRDQRRITTVFLSP